MKIEPIPQGPSRNDAELSAEDKLQRARTVIFSHLPFFGSLLAKARITIVDEGITTACIDMAGRMSISRQFMSELTSDQLAGLLTHEIMHPALQFYPRFQIRDKIVTSVSPEGKSRPVALFNLAQDFFINQSLIESMAAMHQNSNYASSAILNLPPGGLYNSEFADMSSEEIYDLLAEEVDKNGKSPAPDGFEGDVSLEEGQDGSSASDEEKKHWAEKWKNALVEAQMDHDRYSQMRGVIPAGIRKMIHELLNPRVYWRDVVSRWTGEHGGRGFRTYTRPSRRSEAIGTILQSVRRSEISDICVLLDTSGSMGGRETELVSETIAIAEDLNLRLRVICVDCAIHSDNHNVNTVEDINFAGGGGSDLCPAFERLDEERFTGAVIVYTDGFIGVPQTQPPTLKAVLWVLFSEHHDRQPAPWGEAVRIDPDGFTHSEQGMYGQK